ncbi:MAG: hypothetical protein J6C09_07565 [Clostridia bacterium]|nr:hypothetical protein [Clostridia bacterium]
MKFEKDFDYYIYNAFMLLERGNVITPFDLDNDRRIGLFYIMSIYHISFATYVRGSWEWLSLVKEKGGKPLDAKEIRAMEPDIEVYNKLKEEFSRGILPGKNNETEGTKPKATKSDQNFGWLSPTGEFIASGWGEHYAAAKKIIKSRGFEQEYREYEEKHSSRHSLGFPGDFLSEVKGYCLIHNPTMDGGYIVTHIKPHTKKQREFLYNYFAEMGNMARASMYLEEGSL